VQFSSLPPLYVHYEARKVENEIAYFSLNTFFDPTRVIEAFAKQSRTTSRRKGSSLTCVATPAASS